MSGRPAPTALCKHGTDPFVTREMKTDRRAWLRLDECTGQGLASMQDLADFAALWWEATRV